MVDIIAPQSAEPEELFRWANDFVQRLMLEREIERAQGGGLSGLGGGSGGGAFRSGMMVTFAGSVAPEGWLLCIGQLLDRQSYPGLFSAVGTKYNTGGEDAALFRLPDSRGKVPLGSSATIYGGAAEVVLTLDTLPEVDVTLTQPAHAHGFTGSPHTHGLTDPQHTHPNLENVLVGTATVNVAAGATPIYVGTPTTLAIGNAATGVTVNNATAGGTVENATTNLTGKVAGGGNPVPTLPPYFSALWIIKT